MRTNVLLWLLAGLGASCMAWAQATQPTQAPQASQASQASQAGGAAARKVLNVAFRSAETGFDPAMLSDLYSRTVTPHIFEGLYTYDHLHRPSKIKPLIATALPEVSPDYKVWTVRIRPGIYFQDDPAFKGQKRELVAQDFVFAFQRTADPRLKSQLWGWIEGFGLLGLADYRREVVASKGSFDYDRPIAGLRALDRYTLRFEVDQPRPRFLESLASSDLLGGIAREVVDFYGDKIAAHPVGTGPFRLKSWRRSSEIVLERNPEYREVLYDAEPAPGDTEGQAILARLKGKRIPMIDEVRISIIQEDQPRWLSFLNGQIDMIAGQYGPVPESFITVAMPNGKVAPNLARQGVRGQQQVNSDVAFTYFNMEDPVVGGYTADKVALRRAMALAMDLPREITIILKGQAVPAQSNIVPHTVGYDAAFKSEAGDYDPARARALLELYGYVDKDGDGYRELPDGQPLVIEKSTLSQQIYRQRDELLRKNLDAVGIRVVFKVGEFAEMLKLARSGKLQVWSLASSAASPDGQSALYRLHGPQAGSQNLARFKLAEFDALYDRMAVMPNGPERDALFLQAKKIGVAYMPYKPTAHRISSDLWYPWIVGYRRPVFWQEWWHLIDIDLEQLPKSRQARR